MALSPRDAGYRQLLADIYLKQGRFASARTTYADVLELDPSNVRAALSVALLQIAEGNPTGAAARLEELDGRAPAADLGLAFALAGRGDRAVQILEEAARAPGATARTRQNLALAYAMTGDWRRARAVAAQDLSPAELPARLQQWAAFARPGAGQTRVAALLGVTPAEDPGQPVRLALRLQRRCRRSAGRRSGAAARSRRQRPLRRLPRPSRSPTPARPKRPLSGCRARNPIRRRPKPRSRPARPRLSRPRRRPKSASNMPRPRAPWSRPSRL